MSGSLLKIKLYCRQKHRWVNLDENLERRCLLLQSRSNFGHEQAGTRPVVVLQTDMANEKLGTVMVAPLTSNLKAAGYLLTHLVMAQNSGLPKDSVILLFQVRTVDKRRLERKIGHLNSEIMAKVDQALRIAFDL